MEQETDLGGGQIPEFVGDFAAVPRRATILVAGDEVGHGRRRACNCADRYGSVSLAGSGAPPPHRIGPLREDVAGGGLGAIACSAIRAYAPLA